MNLMYINWNPDPVIFTLGGFSLRWYSVFWIIAIVSASIVVHKIFNKRKWSEDDSTTSHTTLTIFWKWFSQ